MLWLRVLCLQVVDKTQAVKPGLMALSCFGFGGANFHMVLKGDSGSRMQLLQSDSSSNGSTAGDASASDNIVPLAARTADGLTYLAKVVKEVKPGPIPPNLRKCSGAHVESILCSCTDWADWPLLLRRCEWDDDSSLFALTEVTTHAAGGDSGRRLLR